MSNIKWLTLHSGTNLSTFIRNMVVYWNVSITHFDPGSTGYTSKKVQWWTRVYMEAAKVSVTFNIMISSVTGIPVHCDRSWWRHQMEPFSALLAICAENSSVTGEFPAQRPVTRSFHVFFDLRLNKRLSKQSWDWWFETLSRPLWRHCNVCAATDSISQ